MSSEEGRLAHRKLWRQLIFWLSHKENDSENHVKLSARPAGEWPWAKRSRSPPPPATPRAPPSPTSATRPRVEREGPDPSPEPVDLYDQGEEARGSIYATEKIGQPGNYTVTTIARRDGQELGRDKARFLVYQDDRELENPSADLKLAREIAEITGGEPVTPERLGSYLKGIDRSVLHRIPEPIRVQSLGQLAVPLDLRGPAHPRVVAPQATRLGLSSHLSGQ